ncbi:MAG: hypothetical protein HOG49_15660, partial [Candidatus Scalindua sp.]|nr:hypothetical protein [Candidatus Scalindua sp.]
KELGIDLVKFNNATPYPGTSLYNTAKRENRLNIQGLYENFYTISAFAENPFRKIPFSYVPEGNTEEEIRNDILYSHFAFYFSFNRIKKIFKQPTKGLKFNYEGTGKIIDILKEIMRRMPSMSVVGLMLAVKFFQLFVSVLTKKNTSLTMGEFVKLFTDLKKGNEIGTQINDKN